MTALSLQTSFFSHITSTDQSSFYVLTPNTVHPIPNRTKMMDISKINVSHFPVVEDTNDEQRTLATQFSPAQQLFFRQLHFMLMRESPKGCVKWLDDMKGFTITDKDIFSRRILPRYFGEAKYASFTRRLKRWGFRRITKVAASGAYYHDAFYRDMNFDDFEDIGCDTSCSESSESVLSKKGSVWSPLPSNAMSYANKVDFMNSRCFDISVMPEIMRDINRSKRSDNYEQSESASKIAKLDNHFYDDTSADHVHRNHGYSSHGNFRQTFHHDPRFDYLSHLERQVYQENFNMESVQSRLSMRNSMRSSSNISTEVLKQEIDVRRMQEMLALSQNNSMHREKHFSDYEFTPGYHH